MIFTKEHLIEQARENVKALKMAAVQSAFKEIRPAIELDLRLAEIALAALESRADAELAEIEERAAFTAWNNDTECPLAGRDAKSAAWLAWSRRAAMLAAAPQQEAE
ncbi:hypothetical protein [Atlantibacter hermannii]|uniref:hypothetical protein n=1 Tax=Atlantibacter hermannii TaxID=565 RepID=UPI0035E40226